MRFWRIFAYRFMNRRLFQYVEFDPATEYRKIGELEKLFKEAGIDPEYYLVADSSSDLPYDFYRPGKKMSASDLFANAKRRVK